MISQKSTWKEKIDRLINEEHPFPRLNFNPKVLFGWLLIILGGFGFFLSVFTLLGTIFSTLKIIEISKKAKLSLIISNYPILLPLVAIIATFLGFWLLKNSRYALKKNLKLLITGSIILIVIAGIFVYTTKLYKDPSVANPKSVLKELKKGDVQNELRQDFWGNLDKKLQQIREKTN